MTYTLAQHAISNFIISDIQPKLKFDSRSPDVLSEITFYLSYSSFNAKLITLLSMSEIQRQSSSIKENAELIDTLSEDDPVTLEDMAELERSKDEISEEDLADADFYIEYGD